VSGPGEVTRLLVAIQKGDRDAFDRLVVLVYDDLRRIARSRLRGRRSGDTLDTTALVHEAWLRLAPATRTEWSSREHFFCVAARAMRQIVVSNARRHLATKRGGGERAVTLETGRVASDTDLQGIVDLGLALDRLAMHDETLARVVECRHFAGMTGEETARALGLSERTVERHWVRARAWLRKDLGGFEG
jgi:RNA polymerase sigma factor (TIGR02999 family)